MKTSKKELATLAATVAAAGGLLSAAPAAHASQVTPASCDSLSDLAVLYTSGWQCDPSHSNHRDPINRCDVLDIESGSNWVAAWVGPTPSNLHYVSAHPNTSLDNGGDAFCVGDIAVGP